MGDAARWGWRLLTSRRTAVTLLLALGLLTLAGTLLDQAPHPVRDDPADFAAWVDSVRPRYRGLTDAMVALGLFGVFHSLWFVAATAMLGASTLACTVNRVPGLWRRSRPYRPAAGTVSPASRPRAVLIIPAPVEDVVARVRRVLRRSGFRPAPGEPGSAPDAGTGPGAGLRTDGGPGPVTLHADRFRRARLATLVTHTGLVLILVGIATTSLTGLRDPQVAVQVGSRVDVGHGTGLSLEATGFSDSYATDGSALDHASDLVVYRDGRPIGRGVARVNHPLRRDGVSITQSYHGTAAELRVSDPNGRVLFSDGVPLQWASTDGDHTVGRLAVPGPGLTVDVVVPAPGRPDPTIGPGQVRLQVHRPGADGRISTALLTAGVPATVDGLSYTFVRERPFTGLSVSVDPGKPLVWLGVALLVLGMSVTFSLRHRRLSVQVRSVDGGSEVRLSSPQPPDQEAGWFHNVVRALDPSTTSPPR